MGRQNPGYVVNLGYSQRGLTGSSSAQSTSSAPITLIAAGSVGVYNDIVTFICTNESNVATVVSLSDGTQVYKFALSPNGGGVFNFLTPLPATNFSTDWTVSNSAGVPVDCVVVFAINTDPN
jgi:hypothetical protein